MRSVRQGREDRADHVTDMTRVPPPIVYVDCDLPEGVTLDEWRRSRARPAKPTAARRARRAGGRLAQRLRPRR
jgi:hypothetical protein